MKENPNNSGRAVALIRILLAVALISTGALLLASSFAQTRNNGRPQQLPGTQRPDILRMIGPVSQDQDLRALPQIPANFENEDHRLVRHPFPLPRRKQTREISDPIRDIVESMLAPSIPSPLLTFAGMGSPEGCGSCLPPDTDGDVGPDHYVASVNSSIRIHDKSGKRDRRPHHI
jgi:hypothetical protein